MILVINSWFLCKNSFNSSLCTHTYQKGFEHTIQGKILMRFNEKTKFRLDNFADGGLVSASLSHSHKKVDIPPSVR